MLACHGRRNLGFENIRHTLSDEDAEPSTPYSTEYGEHYRILLSLSKSCQHSILGYTVQHWYSRNARLPRALRSQCLPWKNQPCDITHERHAIQAPAFDPDGMDTDHHLLQVPTDNCPRWRPRSVRRHLSHLRHPFAIQPWCCTPPYGARVLATGYPSRHGSVAWYFGLRHIYSVSGVALTKLGSWELVRSTPDGELALLCTVVPRAPWPSKRGFKIIFPYPWFAKKRIG